MTDDDRLLEEVAAEARRRREADEASAEWEALARGELSPDEVAALGDRADDAEDDALAWALYEPLSDRELGGAEAALVDALAGSAPEPVAHEEEGLVERWLGWFGRLGMWIALPVAAIAAAVFFWPVAHLPAYSLSPVVGDAALRAPGELGEVRLTPTSSLELVLKPSERPESAVDVRLFVRRGANGPARRVDLGGEVEIQVTEAGVVRIAAPAAAVVGAERGGMDLLILIGPSGAPERLDPASPGAGVQVFVQPVHVLDSP